MNNDIQAARKLLMDLREAYRGLPQFMRERVAHYCVQSRCWNSPGMKLLADNQPETVAICPCRSHQEGQSKMFVRHREQHRTDRIGWLRAAVLGANDGILSTASLVLGVAAAHATHSNILVAGVAGLVAGSMSMAAGEYVSVHSQADTERADLALERAELKADDKGEHKELTAIYVARGLKASLAKEVANQLMAHDALGAHARDELGISETLRARPIQAALASAASFAVGAAMPIAVTALAPTTGLIALVSGTSLIFLALLGGLAARAGGARVAIGAMRVTFWGALAMAVTAGVGWLFGTVA